MKPARTLIVGASGQVGMQMLERLGGRALPTSRSGPEGWLRMDLSELTGFENLLDGEALEAVYCMGGMTHVDGCEAQPELAWRTNAVGPGVLAAYARRRGLPFVFFSTEYVFDGFEMNPGLYTEDAPVHPLSVYGRSKLEGEQRVLDAHPDALVLRTTVVYGPDPRQMNYVYALLRNLSGGATMRVPEDQVSTPTYNRDLIAVALGLVRAGAAGVFHVAGPERMGRMEFAQKIAQRFGLDVGLLEGVSTAALGQAAARPLDAGLATGKLRRFCEERHLNLHMRTLDESLNDCWPELVAFLQRARQTNGVG